MGKLKYHTMRKFAFKIDKLGHCLVSGVRKFESTRRFGNYKEPILQDDKLWFCSPMFYKTSEELYRYIHENGLRITPVHEQLGFSGECMCGSFASHGEKLRLRQVDPNLADYIEWLEDGVQRFGTKQAKKYSKWGDSAKMSELEQQQYLDQFLTEYPELKSVNELEPLVCGSECGAGTMRGMLDF
jgi:3'-phosphoadenosine 5'-phosphosulfate sulfotransferase (PAPS reductase)/FAD synthetase